MKSVEISNNFWNMTRFLADKKFKSQGLFNRNDALICFSEDTGICIRAVSSLFMLLLFVFLMQGCSSTYAPVENRRAASYDVKKKYTGKTPAYHRVKQGDTLYSIAWSYGQDYKSIAYRNNIKPPYRIFVGDALRLTTTQSSYGTKSRVNSAYKKRTTSQHSKKGIVKSTPNKKTQSKKTTTNSSRYSGSKQLYWNWPVKGKVIQRYLPQKGKKGIDISAAKGTLIKSAEAGKVVYSGQGLVGYGRLIIIKHNDIFLSAYAHNQNLLVNEGQLVKKGQNIARLGRSGTDRYKLHFEIRKHGKPVNPMSYLPH